MYELNKYIRILNRPYIDKLKPQAVFATKSCMTTFSQILFSKFIAFVLYRNRWILLKFTFALQTPRCLAVSLS